jgi:septum formation protein
LTPLVLASASPRRAELLRAAGIPFEVLIADVDETALDGEEPDEYVRRIADAKATAAAARAPGRVVLAADTIVVVEGQFLGKPTDEADARAMLRRLSGRVHEVWTGVALLVPNANPNVRPRTAVLSTAVEFARMSDADIDWYVASREPLDKAGGYAIQGLASRFVTRINGSYSNVVGLPVALVYDLCREAGIQVS